MHKTSIPKLFLLGMLMLTATAVWATQVKIVSCPNGSGVTSGPGRYVHLTIGQPLVGRTRNVASHEVAVFGIWDVVARSRFVSPVADEMPAVSNGLGGNYPNPFNPSTRISFTLAEEGEVRIELYDLRGRKVDTLFEGIKPAGAHSFVYQPKSLASGAYVILMRAGSFRATRHMMLVK